MNGLFYLELKTCGDVIKNSKTICWTWGVTMFRILQMFENERGPITIIIIIISAIFIIIVIIIEMMMIMIMMMMMMIIIIRVVFKWVMKTKTKVITLANQKGRRHRPVNQSKLEVIYMKPTQSVGKCARASHNWFWLHFWLVEKVALKLWTNHWVK